MSTAKIWAAIEDWLIPTLRLNTHERALYYHLVRRTRLDGRRTTRISRSILARVSGLSPGIARHYLRSLARKQCVLILDRRPQGCLVEVRLPSQIRRALARLPQAAAAHLLWPPNQLERTAAGHPRAWPRPHPLVAPNFRAAILHRHNHSSLSPLRLPCPKPPCRKLSSLKLSSLKLSPLRLPPEGQRNAVCGRRTAKSRSSSAHSRLSSRVRRGGRGICISRSPLNVHPSNFSTFQPSNVQPSTRPSNPSTFQPFNFQPSNQPSTRHLNPSTFRPFNISTFSSTHSNLRSSTRHAHRAPRRTAGLKPRCFYCRAPLRPRQWALDHIVPRTLGGSDSPSNLVAACHSCNSQKASSPADLFLRSLHRRRIIPRRHLHRCLKSLRSLLATRH